MSFEATKWAWQQKLKANPKVVLLSFANRADDNGVCFPSVKRLVDDTGLDRKTVLKYIQYLDDIGLVSVIRKVGSNHKFSLNLDQNHDVTYPKNGTGGIPKTGQVEQLDPSQKRDGGYPKNGTGGIPKTGQEVSQKRDTESNNNLSTNLSVNLKESKICFSNLPESVSVELAEKYIQCLVGLGVVVKQRIFDRVMREVLLVPKYGFTPAQALRVAMDNRWVRFESVWFAQRKKLKPDLHGGFENKVYETDEPAWVTK